ncbi:hypothetical protein AAFC00_000487 [Neodothiora populina]|uniref:Fork-head domain-containing protein n=1 Tax=Neodothiora populina TaxID=2781224 RepID=A0ABR3PD20_9PEZI
MTDYATYEYAFPPWYAQHQQHMATFQTRLSPPVMGGFNAYAGSEQSQTPAVDETSSQYDGKDFRTIPHGSQMFDMGVPVFSNPSMFDVHGTFNGGLLPTSIDPSTSALPWTYSLPPQSSANYLPQGPAWPSSTANYEYCPCEQYLPVQLPELGYESSSPASDRPTCPRVTASESPRYKNECDDEYPQTVSADSPDEDDSDTADPCYAELLRKCLLEAPNHTMSLRDLYTWVAEHSPKARDPNSTGWKNSVRHNLSMNQGFEKVVDDSSASSGSKQRSFWRLTDDAVTNGIQSTTRYRKGDGKRKAQRANRNGTPDDKRVKSGAKGGQATRRLANRRAAAAARSTNWHDTSRHGKSYRDEPYPSRARAVTTVSPSPMVNIPLTTESSYWPTMVGVQDQAMYTAPFSCKIENDTPGFGYGFGAEQSWMAM